MIQPITIELFGHLAVKHGDDPTTRFRTQKTATLLAYLAFYAHRAHPREELIDLLWPDVDMEAGRTSLRTALASLRRQLEPADSGEDSLLVADRVAVRLNPQGFQTDVAEFEAALQSAYRQEQADKKIDALHRVVTLYRGPLLPGWYDDWALRERTRLEQAYLHALRDLADALETQGRIDAALPIALRRAEMDRLTEEAHLTLMRLYAALGQLPAAKRQFREWQRIAKEELGESPSPDARALLERLAENAHPAPVPAGKSPAPSLATPLPISASVPSVTGSSVMSPSHLPMPLTRFFGRESEIEQARDWLCSGQTRLLTLTGPGGTGKTRLALEVASRLALVWGNAAWFVPLADVTEAERMPETLAKALNLRLSPDADPQRQIADALPDGPLLIVLDNFEQLPEKAALPIQELLTRVPNLRCLVTSRVPLSLDGEQVFAIAPLPSPVEQQEANTPASILRFASVQMFVDRARLVRSDFQVTPANAELVAALCRKLEGIPLAIELTAAWAQTLTPAQMLERLNRRFDLLTSRRKDLPPRHRTLRATVEWSYRLLSPDLQRFFAQLSIFRGGWTLEAAETIAKAEGGRMKDEEGNREQETGNSLAQHPTPNTQHPPSNVLEQLALLCERSLVSVEEQGEGMRYRLLETLREYGLEQIAAAERPHLEARHRDFFLAFVEDVETHLEGPEQIFWLDRLEQEHDNFGAALRFSQQAGDWDVALRLAGALSEFWHRRGYAREGLQWLETLVAQGQNISPSALAKALSALATIQYLFGDFDRVLELYQQSITLYEQVGDNAAMAKALERMHTPVFFNLRDVARARSLLERSLGLGRQAGDLNRVAETLIGLGSLAREQNDYALAASYYNQSLALHRQIGNRNGMAQVLFEIGYMSTLQGDYARAEEVLQESLTISRELNNKLFNGHLYWLLGRLREKQGAYGEARALLEESLLTARQSGDHHQAVSAFTNLGLLAEMERDYATASARFAESLVIARAMGHRWKIAYAQVNSGRVALHLQQGTEARSLCCQSLSLLQAGGSKLLISECLLMLAQVAVYYGQTERACLLLGAVDTLREMLNHPLNAQERDGWATCLSACRTALGEAAFSQLWEEGRSLPLEDSVELALMVEPATPDGG